MSTPHPTQRTGAPPPAPVEATALVDLPEGSVVYSRVRGAEKPVGVMILAGGTWRMAGVNGGVSHEYLVHCAGTQELAELGASTEFWVLPTP